LRNSAAPRLNSSKFRGSPLHHIHENTAYSRSSISSSLRRCFVPPKLGYIGVSEGAITLDFFRNTEHYISLSDNWNLGGKHYFNHLPFITFRRVVQRSGNSTAMDEFRGPQKTVGPGIRLHNLSYTSQAKKANSLRYNGHFPCGTRSTGTKDKFTYINKETIPNIGLSNTLMFCDLDCL